MGYLDNTSVTVDAVLTKKGREILSNGGNLNIASFTCTDTGVDYTLWNPDHPSGSAFYGEAIENLPMLEASVHAEYALRNRLITLNQNTIAIPALVVDGLTNESTNTLTFDDSMGQGHSLTISLKGLASNSSGMLQILVFDNTVAHPSGMTMAKDLSGAMRTFLVEEDINQAKMYETPMTHNDITIKVMPNTTEQDKTRETSFIILESSSGAYAMVTIENKITKLVRNTLGKANIVGP